MKKNAYTVSILAAGCLWGFMGLFRRYMGEAGFTSSGVIVLRCGVAAVCFGLTLLFTGPAQFKVKLRDLWCFLGSGVVSLLFFTFCYFQAMNYMSLSAAAILLYTAPAIVTLFSALLFLSGVLIPWAVGRMARRWIPSSTAGGRLSLRLLGL